MSYDTLVFICETVQDGAKSARHLPRDRDLNRFFIFLTSEPDSSDLDWFSPKDNSLFLPIQPNNIETSINMATRAGLMYSGGWGILYCNAKEPPSIEELAAARQALLQEEGTYRSKKLWGASREAIVLNGFASIYQSEKILQSDQPKTSVELAVSDLGTVNDIDLALAIKGEPSSASAVLAALRETVPLKQMSLDKSAQLPTEPYLSFLASIVSYAASIDDEFPNTIVLGSRVSQEYLHKALEKLPKYGAVVIVKDANNSQMLENFKPYQTMYVKGEKSTDKGYCVLCLNATKKR